MAGLRNIARLAVALGLVSVLAVVLSHLALTDIAHGEPDLVGEWWVLRASFAVIIAFQVVALVTLARFLGRLREDGRHPNRRIEQNAPM